jgi:hypothetical protein
MRKNDLFLLACGLVLCVVVTASCSDSDDLPVGPCNNDGDTVGGEDEVGAPASGSFEFELSAGQNSGGSAGELRPAQPELEGWMEASGLDGLYRYATVGELRQFNWPEHTLVVATPFGILEQGQEAATDAAWIVLPTWDVDRENWVGDEQVVFERQTLSKVQTLALGHFVEHHRAVDGSPTAEVRHPIFELYGAENRSEGSRSQLLTDSSGALLLRRQTPQGRLQLSAPHGPRRLDVPPPLGFQVAVVSPSEQDITRGPLTPFSCENGQCEDPDDPLDECNDGIDNDEDGHGDLCDWNCLPHSDFGAHHFPEARSRVEHGKNYALMGGGGICTELGETWMVTFADWALQASELLNEVRPGENDPLHYRIFSCWVFEDEEAFLGCQHGVQFMNGEPVGAGDSVCPAGMEDYPYRPSDGDPQPGLLLYGEATSGAWRDLQINTVILGPYGEPVNGTGFLTNNTTQTCPQVSCNPAAGLATVSPFGDIWALGSFVVSNANANDWVTLAHETGHTLGLVHDDIPQGIMSESDSGPLPELGTSVDIKYPNLNNNVTWEGAFASKHSYPRSSGWYWTGCHDVDDVCAPLGKPGWSCKTAWCEPE